MVNIVELNIYLKALPRGIDSCCCADFDQRKHDYTKCTPGYSYKCEDLFTDDISFALYSTRLLIYKKQIYTFIKTQHWISGHQTLFTIPLTHRSIPSIGKILPRHRHNHPKMPRLDMNDHQSSPHPVSG